MMSVILTEVTREELQEMIERAVWKAFNQILQDPDYGLDLREEIIERLRADADLAEDEFIPAEEVAAELGLEW